MKKVAVTRVDKNEFFSDEKELITNISQTNSLQAECPAPSHSNMLKIFFAAPYFAPLFLCQFKSNNPARQTNFEYADTCRKVTRIHLP